MDRVNDPATTLAVTLGASEFPRAKNILKSTTAFQRAHEDMFLYLTSSRGYGLPLENALVFFDSPYDPNTLDDILGIRLRQRIEQLQAQGRPPLDLIVYYVGHGSFDEQRRYYLALKTTRSENQSISSLRMETLMRTLDNIGLDLRKYVIIDACFAGEAALHTQSAITDAVTQQIKHLPLRGETGTTFLCSSSRELFSEFLSDESNTLFTKAFCESLWDGDEKLPSMLSLEDLQALTEQRLMTGGGRFIRPEIHSPVQPQGDIAKFVLFPNGPRRMAKFESTRAIAEEARRYREYLESEREQQNRQMDKIRADKATIEENARESLLAEQRQQEAVIERESQHYGSEEEKNFRDEAEIYHNRLLENRILVDWLHWKARDCKVKESVYMSTACEFEIEEGQNNFYAGNVYSNLEAARKTSSSDYVDTLQKHWFDLRNKAEQAEKSRLAALVDAEDQALSSKFFSTMAGNSVEIDKISKRARTNAVSFQEELKSELIRYLAPVRRARRARRFVRTCFVWSRRIIMAVLLLAVIGFCVAHSTEGS